MAGTFRLEVAVTPEEADAFEKTARELGLEKETAIEIFMRRFIASGGFPFAMRKSPDAQAQAVESLLLDEERVNFLKESIGSGDWGELYTADDVRASLVSRGARA